MAMFAMNHTGLSVLICCYWLDSRQAEGKTVEHGVVVPYHGPGALDSLRVNLKQHACEHTLAGQLH